MNRTIQILLTAVALLVEARVIMADCRELEDSNQVKVSATQRENDNLIEVIIDAPTIISESRLESVVLVLGDTKNPDYVASLDVFKKNGRSKLVLDGKEELIKKSLLRVRYYNENECHKVLLTSLSKIKIIKSEK